jgi:flagellar biosynthesis component FlhA
MVMLILIISTALDILIAMNLIFAFALLIFIIVLRVKKAGGFLLSPPLLLISTIISLFINISASVLILYKGAAFDGPIIRFFSGLIFGSGGIQGLVVGLIVYITIVAFLVFVINKKSARDVEVAARFVLDFLPGKQLSIDNEYAQEAITEEERKAKIEELQREIDFYASIDGTSSLISGAQKINITITVITIIAGILIGTNSHGGTILDAARINVPLAISSGILSMAPFFLYSANVIIVARTAKTHAADFQIEPS